MRMFENIKRKIDILCDFFAYLWRIFFKNILPGIMVFAIGGTCGIIISNAISKNYWDYSLIALFAISSISFCGYIIYTEYTRNKRWNTNAIVALGTFIMISITALNMSLAYREKIENESINIEVCPLRYKVKNSNLPTHIRVTNLSKRQIHITGIIVDPSVGNTKYLYAPMYAKFLDMGMLKSFPIDPYDDDVCAFVITNTASDVAEFLVDELDDDKNSNKYYKIIKSIKEPIKFETIKIITSCGYIFIAKLPEEWTENSKLDFKKVKIR